MNKYYHGFFMSGLNVIYCHLIMKLKSVLDDNAGIVMLELGLHYSNALKLVDGLFLKA